MHPISRRSFLVGAGSLLAGGVLAACRDGGGSASTTLPRPDPTASLPRAGAAPPTTATTTTSAHPIPPLPGDPFTLGVASGDPLDDAVILWTRLAPEPLAAGGTGGMPAEEVPVAWEVAGDEAFTDVVASGSATAGPDHAHTVHVDATGLEPATAYWYRFVVGPYTSPVGPHPHDAVRGRHGRHADPRPRLVPALRDRLLRRASGHRIRRARRPRLAGRLHLRGHGPSRRRGRRRRRPQPRRTRAHRARRLPQPVRALPHRRGPAGRARVDPVVRDLGRPRGRERLRRGRQPGRRGARRVPAAPGRRVPGMVGAPAGPPPTARRRRLRDAPAVHPRPAGHVVPPRRPPAPHRPGLRRRQALAGPTVPGDVRPGRTMLGAEQEQWLFAGWRTVVPPGTSSATRPSSAISPSPVPSSTTTSGTATRPPANASSTPSTKAASPTS